MIGIIASMDEELKMIKEKMTNIEIKNINESEYFIGNLEGKDVVAVKCFTGKVAMAMTSQKLIQNFNPDLVINVGVAGGLKDGIRVGDVVFATSTTESDMDVTMLGYKMGEVPDINVTYFDQYERVNQVARDNMHKYGFKVFFGNILTADKFISSKADKEYLIDTFNGFCTDMETAALAHVCYVNNVLFAGIRGISDSADEGANTDFKDNLKKASDNCALALIDVVKGL